MDLDFYTRNIDNITQSQIELDITDDLSLFIVQIENILFSEKRDVIGQEDYGLNLYDLLFTFNKSEMDIKKLIFDNIQLYCPMAQIYKVSIDVKFYNGGTRDIAMINIYIEDNRVIEILL